MQLRVSAIIFQLYQVIILAKCVLKPGFHIIAPIAPMAPIARNSVQAIRAIHCFHMIARKFNSIVPIARIEQSSIWAITIVLVAPIVPQLSENLLSSAHVVYTAEKQVISTRGKDNKILHKWKMYVQLEACKNTVFHC